jgi:hypothetical protein
LRGAFTDAEGERYAARSKSFISQRSQKRDDIIDFLITQRRLLATFATVGHLFQIDIHVVFGRQVIELRYQLAGFPWIPIFRSRIATDVKSNSITEILYLSIVKKHLPCGDVTQGGYFEFAAVDVLRWTAGPA